MNTRASVLLSYKTCRETKGSLVIYNCNYSSVNNNRVNSIELQSRPVTLQRDFDVIRFDTTELPVCLDVFAWVVVARSVRAIPCYKPFRHLSFRIGLT